MFESILCQVTEYEPDVLTSLIELAVEIAREGREGRRVGTLFTLGDEKAVLARSRPFRSLIPKPPIRGRAIRLPCGIFAKELLCALASAAGRRRSSAFRHPSSS
jgi:hypothetical protein